MTYVNYYIKLICNYFGVNGIFFLHFSTFYAIIFLLTNSQRMVLHMRIALCDDDKKYIAKLETVIHKWCLNSGISIDILEFNNGIDLILENHRNPIDIIFLDITMPFINGIDTAYEIRKTDEKVKIIFLTKTDKFAVESYKVGASNYILKSTDYSEINYALDNIIVSVHNELENSIIVHINNGFKKIYYNTIEYVEASNKGSTFTLTTGDLLESIDPLYSIEQQLCTSTIFFRCHRSYIVNMSIIDTYIQNEIKTKSGYRLPIARALHKKFKEAYVSLNLKKKIVYNSLK